MQIFPNFDLPIHLLMMSFNEDQYIDFFKWLVPFVVCLRNFAWKGCEGILLFHLGAFTLLYFMFFSFYSYVHTMFRSFYTLCLSIMVNLKFCILVRGSG
jgi:hypothetical protein